MGAVKSKQQLPTRSTFVFIEHPPNSRVLHETQGIVDDINHYHVWINGIVMRLMSGKHTSSELRSLKGCHVSVVYYDMVTYHRGGPIARGGHRRGSYHNHYDVCSITVI